MSLGHLRLSYQCEPAATEEQIIHQSHLLMGDEMGERILERENLNASDVDTVPQEMYPFRIFVSYSHDDHPHAAQIVDYLRSIGAHVLWDPDILPGVPFSEEIKEMIAFSHVFMPLLTAASVARPWVHQEIGFATAVGVPVLPVGLGKLPQGMQEKLQCLELSAALDDLPKRLPRVVIEQLLTRGNDYVGYLPVQTAPLQEDRTLLITHYLRSVIGFGEFGRVRQASSYGSFSIPTQGPLHSIWDARESAHPRSQWLRERFRTERILMEQHARAKGCDLVISANHEDFLEIDPVGSAARVRALIDFLVSMPQDKERKVRVVLNPKKLNGNLIIIGDWFVAESMSPSFGRGYQQTIINRHAPSVLDIVQEFDRDFDDLMATNKVNDDNCREVAITGLTELLLSIKLPDESAWLKDL